jgi:hypothetical protein
MAVVCSVERLVSDRISCTLERAGPALRQIHDPMKT